MKKICPFWYKFLLQLAKNKLGVAVFLFFTFVFGFGVSILYGRMTLAPVKSLPGPEEVPLVEVPSPTITKAPTLASLTLVAEKQEVKSGQKFSVTITLNTGDFEADAVDAVLQYDTKVLAVEKISEDLLFAEYPIKKWKDGKVFLTGVAGVKKEQVGGIRGEGAMGEITFKAISSGSTQVNFDPSSIVAFKGKNVLGETKGVIIQIY